MSTAYPLHCDLLVVGFGSVGHFPHIIDRAKPGLIGVLAKWQTLCQ